MKLEKNDLILLFSNTELPDVFFTEYLSAASGDALPAIFPASFAFWSYLNIKLSRKEVKSTIKKLN